MTIKILDRSKPFGVVIGAHNGTVHFQDGVSFGGDDREIGSPPVETPPAGIAPVPVETPDPVEGAVTREELELLHVSQIKKLVINAGLTYITGQGSKAKNIEQLLAG